MEVSGQIQTGSTRPRLSPLPPEAHRATHARQAAGRARLRPADHHPDRVRHPRGPAAGEKILLFTKTAVYRHDSIPAGIPMFQQLAADNGWQLTQTEDSSVFTDATLSTFDAVVMFQTSGMAWNTAAQRTAFQTYLRNGGGIVAIHNATDMNIESEFPWWDQVLEMTMTQHSATVPGTAKVADHEHPSGQGLPDRWTRTEAWYNRNRV